jgi:hypothetical protein
MYLGDGLDSIFSVVEHADNLDKDVGGLFLLILIMAYGNFRNKIHPTATKINDIF